MKRFMFICSAVAILAAASLNPSKVEAIEDQTLPTDGSFYDAGTQAALQGLSNNVITLITAQSDTNVTTTVTLYTPRRKGDILVGGKGAGTNLVCVSKGTTTNDWVQVAP